MLHQAAKIPSNNFNKSNPPQKNGKEKSIEIKIQDTNENVKLLYKAPGNWLVAQFQLNPYLSIGISIILVLIFIFIIRYFYKKSKLKGIENKKRISEQQEKQAEQDKLIKAQQEQLEKIKIDDLERKKNQEEELRKS